MVEGNRGYYAPLSLNAVSAMTESEYARDEYDDDDDDDRDESEPALGAASDRRPCEYDEPVNDESEAVPSWPALRSNRVSTRTKSSGTADPCSISHLISPRGCKKQQQLRHDSEPDHPSIQQGQ